jgi:hypothetical protein
MTSRRRLLVAAKALTFGEGPAYAIVGAPAFAKATVPVLSRQRATACNTMCEREV